jgi:hypothetical protein
MAGQLMSGDPMNAQAFRTQNVASPEDLWQPLYDRANAAATGGAGTLPASLAFFTTPKGQTATLIRNGASGAFAKTYRDTNMDSANVVPTKLYKFHGLSLAYIHSVSSGAVANDREQTKAHGYIQFRIVDKDILFLPMSAIPELNPVVATTANNITSFATGGGAPMYKFGLPITLNPYENFTFQIVFDAAVTLSAGLDIQVFLQGFMRRPT